jgi:L-ascorbate metabolism protein UlaG (beta-lactamase superfamily)
MTLTQRASKKKSRTRLTLTWLGHSAFLMKSSSEQKVLIDPWLDNPKAQPAVKNISVVDLILVTHGHSDHVGDTVQLAKRMNAPVIALFEVYLYLQSNGVTTAQGINKGGTLAVHGIKVTMVDAIHSSDIDVDGSVMPGGEAAGMVIEFENGITVYHAGDTALFGDMRLIGQIYKPDVALLPIGGVYTMAPREAAKACELLNPKQIIGMHYGTFPILTGTPTELKQYLPARLRGRVRELEPGRAVTL